MQPSNKTYPPFACGFSPNIPELLRQLGCTLAISTYQAGKVVFISALDNEKLTQLPRNFEKAMGIAYSGDKMGIATKNEVLVLSKSMELAAAYPKQPGRYEVLFVPRATYYTGQVDIHDLHWGEEGLWAVNTSFSCVCLINDNYSFTPHWYPPFISKAASEDRCHLNGLAMKEGKPLYVSALGTGNSPQSWRDNIMQGGAIMHLPSGEFVAKNLPMPHTPRIYDGKLYVLFSATGGLACVDVSTGKYEVVRNLSGFVRGMACCGDYLFVGMSRLRQNSSTFKHLPIAKMANFAGIKVLHLPTGALVGEIKYHSSVDEIYDIQVLPNIKRPGILNTQNDFYNLALHLPNATYWGKPNSD